MTQDKSNNCCSRTLQENLLSLVSSRLDQLQSIATEGGDVASTEGFHLAELNGGIEKQAEQMGIAADELRALVQHVDSLCWRTLRPRQSVAFLGPIYSYSYLAAVEYFGMGANLTPVSTIPAAFEEVVREQATFAVVPIENSTDGRVVDTLGMFAKWSAKICGEIDLPIHHCLLGRCSRAQVREVYSKPQAISQCRRWLASHLPEAEVREISSTAAAAQLAAERDGVAAIASREAGLHHGLQAIAENIEDNTRNVTRFAIIGNQAPEPTGRDKTSLMFQLDHQPGALAAAMVTFQQAGVNLTWIESFPLPNCPSEYLFFVELEGHRAEPQVATAIKELQPSTRHLDVLGSYPKSA